jgi:hypothetical protein
MPNSLRELYGLPNIATPDALRPLRGHFSEKLVGMQEQLDNAGKEAFRAGTFNERARIMVDTVSDISSSGIVSELGLRQRARFGRKGMVETALKKTLQRVEAEFQPYFGNDGSFINTQENRQGFDKNMGPMRASGKIAYESLPAVLQACGIKGWDKEKIDELLKRATFQDAIKITAQELGLQDYYIDAPSKESEQLKIRLHGIIPKDNDREQRAIDSLPIQQTTPLTSEEMRVLKIAIRTVQATWLVHQAERAKREGDDKRVHPDYSVKLGQSPDRGVFRVYDLTLGQNFNEHEGIIGKRDALLGTALVETWKDIAQLRKYAIQVS